MKNELSFLGIIFCALYLTGCTSSMKDDSRTVFRYNESGSVNSLDPAYAADLETMWIINQLYDGLVELDQNLDIRGNVAEMWDISSDGLIYTFHLRNNVLFPSDENFKARKVCANDFIFSFNRIIDSTTASPGRWIFKNLRVSNPFEAPNDSTLIIHLAQPQGSFLQMLSTSFASLVRPEAVEQFGKDFRQHPSGTGPFQLAFWEEQVSMVLHRNPNYWMHDFKTGKSLPFLDAVQIDFLKDAFAEYQGFISGKYDFMSGIDAAYIDQLLSAEGHLKEEWTDRIRLEHEPFIKTDYIGFYLEGEKSIVHDLRYRQLLSMTIDRKELCAKLRNNIIVPAESGFIPPQLKSNSSKHPNLLFDSSKVKKLKAELEKYWGAPLPSITLTITPEYADIFEYLQHEWQKQGIDVEISTLQSGSFKEKVAKGQVVAFRKNWLADYPDGENFLQVFTKELFSPNGPNYTHFYNRDWETQYKMATSENIRIKRAAQWNQLDSALMNELPVIPLYHDQVLHFVSNHVDHWSINAINMLDLTQVQKHQ
jgi:peptide/nickel transport system substrate-binding protein